MLCRRTFPQLAKPRMGIIIKKMEQALNREKPPRLTALRGLQMEEQGDPFKILIGTILSARTRDENTTRVVSKLFARFKTPQDLAAADIDEIKKIIHSIGFYNVKAARIKEVSQVLVSRFGGKVDRKSTRLNSSHLVISYAVFCLKK